MKSPLCPKSYALRHKPNAFTLIELLIAVSIFATIATVLYSCFRAGVISWRRINSVSAYQQKIRYATDRINRDFKNAIFLSNIPFEGAMDKAGFIAMLDISEGASLNIARVNYYLVPDKDYSAAFLLLRVTEPVKNLLYTKEQEEGQETKDTRKVEILLNGITELKFSYLMATVTGEESSEIEYEWLDFWDEKDVLPMGVKIEIALFNKEDGSSNRFSKRIWIPVARPIDKTVKNENIANE